MQAMMYSQQSYKRKMEKLDNRWTCRCKGNISTPRIVFGCEGIEQDSTIVKAQSKDNLTSMLDYEGPRASSLEKRRLNLSADKC